MTTDVLRSAPIFSGLTDAELGQIRQRAQQRRYLRDARILQEGMAGGALHVVLEGRVRITKLVPTGGEEALAILDPGQFFGEVEFLDGGPSSANAIAHTDCETLDLAHDEVSRLMDDYPALSSKLLWAFARTLAGRLRDTDDRVGGLLSISRGF